MARETLDARGAQCPGPLMELIARLKLIAVGDEIELLSSDMKTYEDVPLWCEKVGHEIAEREERGDHVSVVVRRSK